MIIKPSLYPWSGYYGYLKHPHEKTEDTSVLFICDKNRTELNIIINQPGSYNTAYEVAKSTHFRIVNIFCISYDINFISDIYRLSRDLRSLMNKKIVNTYFPEPFPMVIDTNTSINHIKKFTFKSNIDLNISIEYFINSPSIEDFVKSGLINLPNGLKYDILVGTGIKNILIPSIMSLRLYEKYKTIPNIEFHLPYQKTVYGGLSYLDIMNDKNISNKDKRLFFVNCFSSIDELIFCKNNGNIQIAEYLHSSLL